MRSKSSRAGWRSCRPARFERSLACAAPAAVAGAASDPGNVLRLRVLRHAHDAVTRAIRGLRAAPRHGVRHGLTIQVERVEDRDLARIDARSQGRTRDHDGELEAVRIREIGRDTREQSALRRRLTDLDRRELPEAGTGDRARRDRRLSQVNEYADSDSI